MRRLLPFRLALLTAVIVLRTHALVPEPLPDPEIAGFRFPESEATLTRWITEASRAEPEVAAAAWEKIHLHGWGLWTALTAETTQQSGGQRLRVFETWATPDDLFEPPDAKSVRRSPLRQLAQLKQRAEQRDAPPAADVSRADRVLGFVKFDPSAAAHVAQQELLRRDTLDGLLRGGAAQIPPFPMRAIAVKPLFQIVKQAELVDGRYHRLKAWAGPPDTPQAFPPAQWPACVWLDVLGGGDDSGIIDPMASADGSSRTAANTYPVAAFLHYRLSGADAEAVNAAKPDTNASAGDYALLVAMHVSTREIARWTWQTFWWTASPGAPPAPSSSSIAGLRPAGLRGAARHYAMALAYTMLSPDQPYVGGSYSGNATYAYNPWIEARFAAADLPDSLAGRDPGGAPAANNTGVQSNCMSCHAQANYNPRQFPAAPRFAGARYVDLTDPKFVGTLQVDFLWSIARHAK